MPRPIRKPTKSLGGATSLKTLNKTKAVAPSTRKQLISTESVEKAQGNSTTKSKKSTRATRSTDLTTSKESESARRPTKQNSSNFSVIVINNRNANRLNEQRSSSTLTRPSSRNKGDVSPRKSSPLKTSPVKTRMVSLDAIQESSQVSVVEESQQSIVPDTPKRRKVTENEWVDSSPLNSSQQENRSPSPRSSPPPLNAPLGVSTPPLQVASVGRTLMRFRSDEGFTPPPPANRLPLQEVRVRPGRDISPVRIPNTPSRTATQRSRNIWSETDTCDSAPPSGKASPFFPRHFTPADFEVFEDDSAVKTPSRERGTKRDSDGAEKTPSPMRSKEAVAASTSRAGSEASDGSDTLIATPVPAPMKLKKAAAAAAVNKKAAVMSTAALQSLMPRRKEPTKKKTVKRVLIDSEGNSQEILSQINNDNEDHRDIYELDVDSEEDELSAKKTVRKGKPAVAQKKGQRAAVTKKATKTKPTKAATAKTGSKVFQPVLPKHFNTRTYGRKSLDGVERADEVVEEEVEASEDEENKVPEKSQRTKNVEEIVEKVKEHFKEVDAWELDFETVSSTE